MHGDGARMRETKKLVGPVKEGGMTNGRMTNEGGKMRGRMQPRCVIGSPVRRGGFSGRGQSRATGGLSWTGKDRLLLCLVPL